MLKEQQEEESAEMFTTSHGWFQRFRSRFNLHNRGISGEVSSANVEGAEKFIQDTHLLTNLFTDLVVGTEPGR